MDLTSQSAGESGGKRVEVEEQPPAAAYVSMVDPFLVEALQNPRHRLTILRMELDIQKFLQNYDIQQFEFPHFPTSYLRLAAHRVAQHYGLQTMVQDNSVDGQGIRILVIKKPESKFPAVCLSDVPAKMSENDKLDQMKVVIRPRPKTSLNDANQLGLKRSSVRSVEERKEEYDRARARIFNSPGHSESEDASTLLVSEGRNLNINENQVSRNSGVDGSRVAIFRDREKDRTDPDYDRSYDRYVRNIPNTQTFNVAPFNMQKFQPPFVHYDSVFPHPAQMPAPPQASLNYRTPVMSPYCAMGGSNNHAAMDGLYMQWPTQSMIYAQSYDQLRHGFFQAPFCQQPLSFCLSQLQNITVCTDKKPNCNGPGAACLDPRFIGGDGIVFYFHGNRNQHFSLVSDPTLHINARFIGLRPAGRPRDFTWIQALGILFHTHTFSVEATKAERWNPQVDHLRFFHEGKELDIAEGYPSTWQSSDRNMVKVERTSAKNSVLISLPGVAEISINVVPVTEEDDRVHSYGVPGDDCFAHLEVQFRFHGLSSRVEGVLGRTYRPDFVNPAKPGVAMAVVGGEDKYRTTSLLAADCKLCVFSPDQEDVENDIDEFHGWNQL